MTDSARAAAEAIQAWTQEGPQESFGEWLAKNCIVDISRVPAPRGWGGTFHERKAERIAARKAAGK